MGIDDATLAYLLQLQDELNQAELQQALGGL